MTRCKVFTIVASGLISTAALFFAPSPASAGCGYFATGCYAPVYYAPPPVYYAPPVVYSYPAYSFGYAPVVYAGGGYYGPAYYPAYRRGFSFGFGWGGGWGGWGGRGCYRPYYGGGRYWCR